MRRRRYLTSVGAGVSVAMTTLAGCAAPGQETGTEGDEATTVGGEETTQEPAGGAGNETDTEPAGEAGNETGTETATGTGTDGGGQQVPSTVSMVTDGSEYYFDPVGLFVEPGESITWVNESGSHSSTSYSEGNPQSEVTRIPSDAEGWNSETLAEEGAEFTHTFEVQGTYDYYCIPHKTLGMVGRLVVGEPSGLEDDPPDGPVPSEQEIVDQGAVSYEEFQSG